jgi:hypothetical protein
MIDDWDLEVEEPGRDDRYVSLSSSPTSSYPPPKRRRVDLTRQDAPSTRPLQIDPDLGGTGMPLPGFGSKSVPRSAFSRVKQQKKPKLGGSIQNNLRTTAFPITTNSRGKTSGAVQVGPRHTIKVRNT